MIKIINKAYETVGILNTSGNMNKNTPYFDDVYHQSLTTGAETLTFKTFGGTKHSKFLEIGNYVAYSDYDGIIRMFQIIEITETHEEEYILEVYCEMVSIELLNEIVRPMKVVNSNLKSFLQTILQETDWEVGYFPDDEFYEIIDFEVEDYTTIYTAIQDYVINKYKGEVDYRIEFVNNKVAHKYIDIYKERGRQLEKVFTYSKNMSSVVKKVDSSNIATALIGVGRDGITFKDAWSQDKPKGQDFIENPEAFKKWNVNGNHIMAVYRYDTDTPTELLIMTRKELANRVTPHVTYELGTELLGDVVHLGSWVGIVDHELDMHLKARVTELFTSKTDKDANKCVLSNFTEVKSKISNFTMQEVISNIKQYLSELETGILTQNAIDNIKRYLTELKLTKKEIDKIFDDLNIPHIGEIIENPDNIGDDIIDIPEGEDTTPDSSIEVIDTTKPDKICAKAREIVQLCTNGKAWYSQRWRTYDYRKLRKIQDAQENSKLKNHIGKYGWDCSSFVGCCYDYAGISGLTNLSCQAGSLMEALNKKKAKYWKYSDDKNLTKAKAGDIIMFANSSVANVSDLSKLTYKKTHHTAIYLGNGKVAHARSYTYGIQITDVTKTLGNTCFFARIKELDKLPVIQKPSNPDNGLVENDGSVETLCWNFFRERGCTKEVTAGIMGNIYRESMMKPNYKSGISYGLFQHQGSRLVALKEYASKKGVSYTTASVQLDHMWWEVAENGEPYTASLFKKKYGSWENFTKLTNLYEATIQFEKLYERANETATGFEKRYKFAQKYYNKYANMPSNSITAPSTSTTVDVTLKNGQTHAYSTLSKLRFRLPETVPNKFSTKLVFTTPNNTAPMKFIQSKLCWLGGADCRNGALIPHAYKRYTITITPNDQPYTVGKYYGWVDAVSYGGEYKKHSGFSAGAKVIEFAETFYQNRSKFKYNTTTPITKYKAGTAKDNKSKWYTGGKYHIDCSTFTNQLFKARSYKTSIYSSTSNGIGVNKNYSWGIDLGRTASDQARYCVENGWYLEDVDTQDDWHKLKKGDLVFWESRSGDTTVMNNVAGRYMQVGHVAVVAEVNGNNVITYEVSNPDGVVLKRELSKNSPRKIIFFARVRK